MMRFHATTCLLITAIVAGCAASTAQAPPPVDELPAYEQVSLLTLYFAAREDGSDYATGGKPFVAMGMLEANESGPTGGYMLSQPATLCCSKHLVRFRLGGEVSELPDTRRSVAVFGRLRPIEEDQRRREAVGEFLNETYVIVPERIVPAERLIARDNIVELADSQSLTVFMRALRATGLEDELRVLGPITVLAPVDRAFERLGEDELESLFQPVRREELRRLVLNHVAPGSLKESDLMNLDSITTMSHEDLDVSVKNGSLRIAGARLLFEDLLASNGVLHLIGDVLPKWEEGPGEDGKLTNSHGGFR